MKNKTYFKFIGIILIGLLTLSSCSNDDEILVDSDASPLFDKWWYDSGDFTADLYFHSNGQYEQKIFLLGQEFTASADWTWENESGGIMKIDNLSGSGQITSSVWFKFSDILDDSFTLQQSMDGIDYSYEVYYIDTDN